jgi:hypothetical protein
MKSSSVLLAAVLSVASLAHANTIVMGPQVFGPSPTDWITTFVFNQFDPSMGTLTGVTITETLTNSDGGTVTNGGTQTATFTVTETIDGFLIVPDGGGTDTLDSKASSNQKFTGLASGGTATYGPFTSVGTTASDSPVDVTPYIGLGTITFNANTMSGENILGAGNIHTAINSEAADSVTVTYTFDPAAATPEPGPMILIGSGLLGVGCLRRRKRA